jgi:hypothetical protein
MAYSSPPHKDLPFVELRAIKRRALLLDAVQVLNENLLMVI